VLYIIIGFIFIIVMAIVFAFRGSNNSNQSNQSNQLSGMRGTFGPPLRPRGI
jgi:hypothetical protein